MNRRTRSIAVLAVMLGLAVAAWLTFSGGESGLRSELVAEFDRYGCASVTDQDWPPRDFYEIPTRFSKGAVERAAIVCNNVGPSTYYFRFADHRELERALASSPRLLGQRLCVLRTEVFTGNVFDSDLPPDPHGFHRICAQHRGTFTGSAQS